MLEFGLKQEALSGVGSRCWLSVGRTQLSFRGFEELARLGPLYRNVLLPDSVHELVGLVLESGKLGSEEVRPFTRSVDDGRCKQGIYVLSQPAEAPYLGLA